MNRSWSVQRYRYGIRQHEKGIYWEHTSRCIWYDICSHPANDKESRCWAARSLPLPSQGESLQTTISTTIVYVCLPHIQAERNTRSCQGKKTHTPLFAYSWDANLHIHHLNMCQWDLSQWEVVMIFFKDLYELNAYKDSAIQIQMGYSQSYKNKMKRSSWICCVLHCFSWKCDNQE